MGEQTVNDLQGKQVVLLPPCQTKTVYTVTSVFKVSKRPNSAEKVRLRHPETGSEQVQYARNVRPASPEELAAGHRIDQKDLFEEWLQQQPFYVTLRYSFGDALFNFDYSTGIYEAPTINVAWTVWKELQWRLEGHQFMINAQAEIIHKQNTAINGVNKLVDGWKDKNYCVMRTLDQFSSEIQQAMQGGAA